MEYDVGQRENEGYDTASDQNPRLPASMSEQLSSFYAASLKKTSEEMKADLDSGMYPLIQSEANNQANQVSSQKSTGLLERVLTERPEGAEEFLLEAQEGFVYEDHAAPDIALSLNENSEFSRLEKRAVERSHAAQRLVMLRAEASSEGTLASVGYFLDTLVSEPIQNVLGFLDPTDTFTGAGDLKNLAQEASLLLYANISREEFEYRFNEILDRVADTGFFSEENPFAVSQFVAMLEEGGLGRETEIATTFQALDVGTAAFGGIAKGLAKGVSRLGDAPRALSKTVGNADAVEVIVNSVDNGVDSALVVENTSSAFVSPARSDMNFLTAPELVARREAEANNASFQALKEYDFGSYVDPAIVEEKTQEWVETLKQRNKDYKKNELNYTVDVDEFGNILGTAILGKSGGLPYTTQAGAEKLAAKVGGEVKLTTHKGKDAWVVHRQWNIKTEGLAAATNPKEVAHGFLHSIMSTTARTTPDLDGRLKRGEAQVALVMRDLSKDYLKARKGVSGPDRNVADQLMLQYRDDPNYNWILEAPTVDKFSDDWLSLTGSRPSQAVKDYYEAVQGINDTDYFLSADTIFKEAVNNGEEMVKIDGAFYRAKVVEVEEGTQVYNPDTGTFMSFQEGANLRVHEIKDYAYAPDGVGAVQYVATDGDVTRRLYHSDVLGYNFGGHRKYTDRLNFFIKQEGELNLADGRTVARKPLTFMGVRLEKEALQAVDEINTIMRGFREGLGDEALTQLIRSNNNWNTSIESVEDMRVFANEHGIKLGTDVAAAGDGEPIIGQGFAGSESIGTHFRNGLNSSKTRGTRPLVGFGGEDLTALNPLQSIERGFAQSVSRRGEQSYLFNAINGWVKAAEKEGAILNSDEVATMSPRQKMEAAVLSTKTDLGKALEAERRTISFRLNNTTADVSMLQGRIDDLADFVYGKGFPGVAKLIDRARAGDATSALRAVAFNTKLGLFALDQLYVQASQLVNIIGIAGPVVGTRGTLAATPLRMALFDWMPEGAVRQIANAQAPFTSISAEEFIRLRDWVKKTGRHVVDQTVVEENNAVTFYRSGFKKVLEAGQTPFREGETLARLGAAATNYIERRGRFPDEDIFDDRVTTQMLHRQDVLTASMTSASSARWQKSLLSVPLQFTTFHVRMFEQIFTNRILSGVERVRLALTQLVVYGAAGAPVAGWAVDKFAYEYGVSAEESNYNLIRYGLLDGALSTLTNSDTAVAARLAAGEGLWDLFHDIFSGKKTIPEFLVGPSGAISMDILGSVKALGEGLFSGNFDYQKYDWARLGRNITIVNRTHNLTVAWRTGQYLSRRSGTPILEDLSQVDAVMLGLGIPLKENERLWTTLDFLKSDDKQLNRDTTEVSRMLKVFDDLTTAEDWEGAQRVMQDVQAYLAIMTPYEREQVLKRVKSRSSVVESTVRKLIRRGQIPVTENLRGTQEDG